MPGRRRDDVPGEGPPSDLRATELEIGGERLLVLSYAIEPPDLQSALGLTAAEAEVAELAIAGLSNGEIAKRRGSSIRTVANQISAVLRKAAVGSRDELAIAYTRGTLGRRHESN